MDNTFAETATASSQTNDDKNSGNEDVVSQKVTRTVSPPPCIRTASPTEAMSAPKPRPRLKRHVSFTDCDGQTLPPIDAPDADTDMDEDYVGVTPRNAADRPKRRYKLAAACLGALAALTVFVAYRRRTTL